jgi:aminomethyltransferase
LPQPAAFALPLPLYFYIMSEATHPLKNTALTQVHIGLGAKMVPFAGYNMPVLYDNLIQEHLAVRNAAGVFDVSHMGEFFLRGKDAFSLIQSLTTNDVALLEDGKVQYSCMTNDQGGIVDDLLVYRISEEHYMLVVNASNIEKDWNWISSHNNGDCQMEDASDRYALLAVQGPKVPEILQQLTDTDLSAIPYYHFKMGSMAGIDNVIISNTGYTGAGGFELYVANEDAQKLWDAVFAAGEVQGIKPCGLGARDTLRLEKGFCLYGNDINDTTSPIEAGLGWITKFNKEFTHSAYHKALKENKPSRKLVGFVVTDKGIARQHHPVCLADGTVIGEVTSGTMSPSLNKAIGMAYVQAAYAAAGTEIFIDVRGRLLKAEVAKIPFL